MIIYLHGFNSSGNGNKVKILEKEFNVISPSYPSNDIDKAIKIVNDLIEKHKSDNEIMLVGTSMGGFIAQYLGVKHNLKYVLINPSLEPCKTLSRHLGKNTNFTTNEVYTLTEDNIKEFEKYTITNPCNGSGTLMLLDSGDKVINHEYAVNLYKGKSQIKMFDGGSHRFDHLKEAMPIIKEYYNAIWD